MLYARDKRTNQDVPASKAKRHGAYICPTCKEPVMLRDGGIRVRHFAHRSGRADPDCDRYYPGSAIGNPLGSPSPRLGEGIVRPRIEPLSLGLRVEAPTQATRNSLRRWRLVLVLPKAPNGIGRLLLPTGKISRDIRLHELIHGAKTFDVSPQLTRFGPEWVSDDADYDYRDVVTNRLDGLDERTAHAFAITGGSIKPQAAVLTWGDSYVLIRRGEPFNLPDLLSPVRLAPHDGWSASVVTLPIANDDTIAAWLQTVSGLRVASSKRQWGILYPPPVRVDANGDIEVHPGVAVTVGFLETADATEAPADVLILAGKERQINTLKRGEAHLYAIARDGAEARLPLHFQWGAKGLPAIVAADENARDAVPEVSLHLRRPEGDLRVPLHRSEARNALDEVRRGACELLAISAPVGVQGRLWARPQRGPMQDGPLAAPFAADDRSGVWVLSAAQREWVAALLCDRTADIRLSFGAFGHYFAAAVSTATDPVTTVLPDALRRRIRWYSRLSGGSRSVPAHARTGDAALIARLRQQAPQPSLAAHRNALLKQLERSTIGAGP